MTGWLRRFPFLSVGVGSFGLFAALMFVDLPPDSPAFRALVTAWHVFGVGPHTAANLLARWLPNIPEALDAGLVVVLGLAPYAGLDAALAGWRRRTSGLDQV